MESNFLFNRYHCGSAREFLQSDGSHSPSQSMTCQWDKTWTPTFTLSPCDWVACLKPPTPPLSAHLRVSDWFGDPIPFGDPIRFVCERGYFFEDDPTQLDVQYTCQDGSHKDHKEKRGFFDVPEKEEDWPRCLLGRYKRYIVTKNLFNHISAPLCPKPPDVPDEGVAEYLPIPIPMERNRICTLDSEDVMLTCNSFLRIYVTGVTYGRDSATGKELCDGEKPNGNSLGSGTCYNETHNEKLRGDLGAECHGTYNCTYYIPTVPLTPDCDGLRREVRTEFICGKFRS